METPIHRPQLPPKNGYVEVEIDGRRTYRNVETGILIDDETETRDVETIIIETLIDQEIRIAELELMTL